MGEVVSLLQRRLSKQFGECAVTQSGNETLVTFPAIGWIQEPHRQWPTPLFGEGTDTDSALRDLCSTMKQVAAKGQLVVIQEYDEPAIHGHGAYPREYTPVRHTDDGVFTFEKKTGTHLFNGTPWRHNGH